MNKKKYTMCACGDLPVLEGADLCEECMRKEPGVHTSAIIETSWICRECGECNFEQGAVVHSMCRCHSCKTYNWVVGT